MKSTKTVAEIKVARLKGKLTQEKLARLAGIPLRTYQRLEAGDRGSKLDTLLRVLDALNLELQTVSKRRPSLDELKDIYGND
ncbi:MAG: helix-turn-helix domain-containing protein [Myxococcota bacterium]|jgi:transcriptional regulator with XRE-family HTH domain